MASARQILVPKLDWAYRKLRLREWRKAAAPGAIRCFTCGNPVPDPEVGHFKSRRHIEIRWADDNTRPQCHDCNVAQESGTEIKARYRENLVAEIGPDRVEALERAADRPAKTTTPELKALWDRFRNRLKTEADE